MPNEPTDPSPRFALAYPIAFVAGVFLLCAWTLHGNRIFAPFAWVDHEVSGTETP